MIRVERGGVDGPVLALIHGMGGTADVWASWRDVLAQRWPGRWLVVDLPGHGGSPALPHYSFDALAEAVAPELDSHDRLVVLGHSLGGVVGLALASGRLPGSRPGRKLPTAIYGSPD